MKRIATLLCLGGILLTGAASAQITPQSLTAWSDDSSTLHPAALALREWRRLDLTEEQVTRMREIEVELSRSFMPFLQRIRANRDRPDPGIWWGEVEVDEEEVRRSYRELGELQAELALRTIELGREVYELLDDDQVEIMKELQQRSAVPPEPTETGLRPCVRGNASGGFRLSPRVKVVYTVSFEEDTARLGVAWVGRAEERLYGSPGASEPPMIPGAPELLSGATMGIWFLGYHRGSHRAWMDTQQVDLGTDNVILLHGIERLHDPPEVVGTLRIPGRIYTGGCTEGTGWTEILEATLMADDDVRAFIDGGEGR